MSAELLINVTPQESRVALLHNGTLQEVHVERTSRQGIVGNIYNGRVSRVLPGMEAAFIDIGLEKAAFLHASDLTIEFQGVVKTNGDDVDKKQLKIADVLYEGKSILVQVIKDPLGTKGARLTTYVTIPSRSLVLIPHDKSLGISSKIEDPAERERLKNLVDSLRREEDDFPGYIIRTAAEEADEESIRADMLFLCKQWKKVTEAGGGKKPAVVYSDLPLVQRVLRDMVGEPMERVRIDSRETLEKVKTFSELYIPELSPFIEHYPGERPIFDLYGVEDEIQKALERQVQLKSGGYLIFDQTESMTTVDVNTGRFVGHRNLEETIFKTNLEAAQTLARQLRLRNLGGIIIIDFIDMEDPNHRVQVLTALEKALAKDYTKTYVSTVSQLGLVEMTRKRTRESLEHVLCEECPTCTGKGYLKTPQTVCYEIFREILREVRQFDANEMLVLASQEVVDLLLDEESDNLAQLQEFVDRAIRFQVEALYTQEQYDIVLM
ncbi:MAG: Cytoplasmic axial filament protein CafA and Ribonuclease G (EC [uncultured Thiotrichaceae bacterium]|uniref:Ribonuclease G n=1 Tax=uncultured Thiotrichaceae bacterium TaxID=298394 RepID=A0A6S6SI79_9GAMM|nr:MAG: Cytoplasmic axial filament protein CafA and Ribonuclease G (EC [uncultured Thiotrichaceae bacterium]